MDSMRVCPACGASLAGRRKRDKFCNQQCHGRWKSEQARLATARILEAGEKPCAKCGVVQPLSEFHVDRQKLDGRRNACKACDLAYDRSPVGRESNYRYYHSPKGKAGERRYRESEKYRATSEAYEARPERIASRRVHSRKGSLRYYHRMKHVPEFRAKFQTEEFRHKRRAQHKRRYQRPEVRRRIIAQKSWSVTRRRTLAYGLPATLTHDEWKRALEWFDHRCAYCGNDGRLHHDHFIPLTAGGGFTASNIIPACPSCNGSKQDRMPEDWCSPEAYERVTGYLQMFSNSN